MDPFEAAILNANEADMDRLADEWNDAALDALRGRPCAHPESPNYMSGYAHGLEEARVKPVMPARPEGYYHSKLEE